MSFNGTDIRRALEAAGPTPAQLKNLTDKLEAAQAVPTRRRPGRRAIVALALCAALVVTAVAAGPSVWNILKSYLGPYAPFAQEMEGTASDQGVRLELVSAVSDGYTAQIFYTITDEEGGRFNADHTTVAASLEGTNLGGMSTGSRIVSYDADSSTLLMEVSATGIDTSQPLELVVEKIDPASYMLWDSRFPAEVPEEPLETETTEDGDVVLKAEQNPQTSPDTDVVRISSVGYDGAGNFHIRLAYGEGITGMLLARPCRGGGRHGLPGGGGLQFGRTGVYSGVRALPGAGAGHRRGVDPTPGDRDGGAEGGPGGPHSGGRSVCGPGRGLRHEYRRLFPK